MSSDISEKDAVTEEKTLEQSAEDSSVNDSDDEIVNQIVEADQEGNETNSVETEVLDKKMFVEADSEVIKNKDKQSAKQEPKISQDQLLVEDKPTVKLENDKVPVVNSKKSKFNEKLKTVYVKKDNVYRKEHVAVDESIQHEDNFHQENKEISLFVMTFSML